MTAGSRKLRVTWVTLAGLLLLGGMAGVLALSDGAVEALAKSISLLCVAYCGGNGVEHLAGALASRQK